MVKTIKKMLAPLQRRILLMVSRCIVTAVNDSNDIQSLQIRGAFGVVRDNVERFQDYGITSHPHINSEGFVSFAGGNTAHGLISKIDDRRYRPKNLEAGEVCFYTDEDKEESDHRIYFKRGKEIHIIAGESSIVLTPAGITITTPSLDIDEAS
jgi:phage baseplate assembly protein V